MSLLVLNENHPVEPPDYTVRKTVKAVIVDKNGHPSSSLIGGGVEGNETDTEALYREALEEAGVKIEIIRPLGEVIGYRDELKLKYVIHGYLCKYLETISYPKTEEDKEVQKNLIWEKPVVAIRRFQSSIKELQNTDRSLFPGDEYYSKLHNRQMSLAFLKEAFKE